MARMNGTKGETHRQSLNPEYRLQGRPLWVGPQAGEKI